VHLWVEIVARELAMLVTLLALGIGPASFLGRRFDAAARLAIAPILGLCLATCVFTTLIWFTAARHTYWLLPVIAAISLTVALRRGLSTEREGADGSHHEGATLRERLRARDALSLAIVCVVVAAPLSYTLHERNSVGPTGFLIMDADGYTTTADGIEQLSIRQARRPITENANYVYKNWNHYASINANIDAAPLAANLDLLIGLHATDTQSLFLIVFLITDALGAFAAVRYFAPRPSWAAPLAGVLFAGPLFLQLMADGSQAATCGIAVMVPMAAVGVDTLRDQRFANLVLFALLASGLMALYPLYLPGIAAAAVIVLVAIAILSLLRHRLGWRAVRRAVLLAAIVVGLTIVFDVVSFTRDVHYWLETIGGEGLAGKPAYGLPLSVIPSWVLQTRQFYVLETDQAPFLPNVFKPASSEVLGSAILPAIFIVVILVGLWRHRQGLVLVSIILVFAALAEYASVAHQCSYCVDRNTLPSAPPAIVLLTLGIVALATSGHRWMRWSAIAVAVVAVIAVGVQTRNERQLFAAGSYFLNDDERALVSDLPAHAGPVDLEGFGENGVLDQAVAELPLVYSMAYERNHGEVSMPSESFNYNSLAYFGGPNSHNPQFTPNYRYVLTRLGGVQTGRRVLARAGPLALEERTSPLDATVTSGIAMPMVRQDTEGLPSIIGPLHLLLVGGGSAPAWVMLRLQTIAPAEAPPQSGVRARVTPHELTVCVQATGTAPVRQATLELRGVLYKVPLPAEKFAVAEPPQGIRVRTMRAVDHCTPAGGA
jgi:hypothetical protein